MRRLIIAAIAACAFTCPAFAQAIVGADSGPVPVEITLGTGTLSSGNALALFSIPFQRIIGGSGIITSVLYKSANADNTAKQAKIWSAKPINTTCTNGAAFVASDVDDAALIGPGIFNFTPAAQTITTGESATYYSLTGLTWDAKNQDSAQTIPGGLTNNLIAPSQNVYICVIAGASDTLDVSHAVRITLSGPQN